MEAEPIHFLSNAVKAVIKLLKSFVFDRIAIVKVIVYEQRK